ncbi:MAG: MFS transporter [Actinomycetota bacterium]
MSVALVRHLRRLDPRLPREVWLLQLGGVVNWFGTGVVIPFLFIYMHNVKGFSNTIAGLVIAANGLFQLGATLGSGWAVDHLGGKRMLAGSLIVQAVAVSTLPLVEEPWQAVLAMGFYGVGTSAFWPSQSTMLVGLTPAERRHAAYAQQRVSMHLGLGIGGIVGGLVANVSDPESFTRLFGLDAITFIAFVAVLRFISDPPRHVGARSGTTGSYVQVFRHRLFMALVSVTFLLVVVGYSMVELLPAFAKNYSDVGERSIGAIFLVYTLSIVLFSLPLSRLLEGKRRMRAVAAIPVVWAIGWMIVFLGAMTLRSTPAALAFGAGMILVGLGASLQGPALGSLNAELARPEARGRYFAVVSMAWGCGLTIGPALGGRLLDLAPLAMWPLAAALCLLIAMWALALERAVPEHLQRVPLDVVEERRARGDVATASSSPQ